MCRADSREILQGYAPQRREGRGRRQSKLWVVGTLIVLCLEGRAEMDGEMGAGHERQRKMRMANQPAFCAQPAAVARRRVVTWQFHPITITFESV